MDKKMMIGAASLLVAGVAQAATISWGAATTVNDATDVSTQGTLLYAESYNLAVSNVNGVDFTQADNTSGVIRSDAATDRTASRTDNVPTNVTQSGVYYDLLRSNWYSADAGKSISLSGLSTGQEYLVQVWSSDDRYGATQNQILDNGAGGAGVTLSTQDGQYSLGTFTADGTSQSISFLTGSSGILNSVQVRAIPEPATLGMVGLMGGGLLFIRRRFML